MVSAASPKRIIASNEKKIATPYLRTLAGLTDMLIALIPSLLLGNTLGLRLIGVMNRQLSSLLPPKMAEILVQVTANFFAGAIAIFPFSMIFIGLVELGSKTTPGKVIFNLALCNISGNSPSAVSLFFRTVLKYLPFLLIIAAFISGAWVLTLFAVTGFIVTIIAFTASFGGRHVAVYDRITGTAVCVGRPKSRQKANLKP